MGSRCLLTLCANQRRSVGHTITCRLPVPTAAATTTTATDTVFVSYRHHYVRQQQRLLHSSAASCLNSAVVHFSAAGTAADKSVAHSGGGSEATESTCDGDADAPCFHMTNPYREPRRLCFACRHSVGFDYKNVRLLSQFVSTFTGRLYERHVTGLCRTQYQRLSDAIHMASSLGLMPPKHKLIEFHADPKLCDMSNPVLVHRYV